MSCIRNFTIINNYGMVRLTPCVTEVPINASKMNRGAIGYVYANFVNGRRVITQVQQVGTTDSTTGTTDTGATMDTTGTSL